ncbi:unnamed protein product [Arctogadus glacialis]
MLVHCICIARLRSRTTQQQPVSQSTFLMAAKPEKESDDNMVQDLSASRRGHHCTLITFHTVLKSCKGQFNEEEKETHDMHCPQPGSPL